MLYVHASVLSPGKHRRDIGVSMQVHWSYHGTATTQVYWYTGVIHRKCLFHDRIIILYGFMHALSKHCSACEEIGSLNSILATGKCHENRNGHNYTPHSVYLQHWRRIRVRGIKIGREYTLCMYVHTYIYMYVHTYIYVYM